MRRCFHPGLALSVALLGVTGALVFARQTIPRQNSKPTVSLASASAPTDSAPPTLPRPTPSPPADVAIPPRDAARAPSGVVSKVLRAGTGADHPEPNDRVTIHYTTWRRDGAVMDGSRLHGDAPYQESLRRLYPGLQEAVRTMVPGEARRVWIPASLTFELDDEDKFSTVDLTTDVELIAIKKAPRAPRALGAPPPSAARLPSGLAYEIVERGAGTTSPKPTSHVTFYHSGWSRDGVLFESSELAGQPETAPLSALLPGLREGIRVLHAGDRARFWVPETLAYGPKPRRRAPAGALTFEVRLLAIE